MRHFCWFISQRRENTGSTGGDQQCHMIYVPARKEIVYANGYVPFVLESVGKEDIISSEAAIARVMQARGVSDKKDIEIVSTELVYHSDTNTFMKTGQLYPYWRVDFELKGRKQDNPTTKNMLIDAITGQSSGDDS